MRPLLLWCAFAAFGLHAVAAEQSDATQPASRVDTGAVREFTSHFEIVVTAPRQTVTLKESPAATSVVDKDWMQNTSQQISVDEALKLVPGVRIDNQATGKRVHMSIRGQGILTERGIRGIKILLDGIPLNDPSGFASDFYDVDWSSVDRTEVLRGPAAALYGGGSSGGVVNIVTEVGGPKAAGVDLETIGGSHNFWKGLAAVSGSADQLSYRASLVRITGDGYRNHTRFHGNNAYGKLEWDPSPALSVTPVLMYTEYFNENAEGLDQEQVLQDPRQANPDALTYNEFQDTRRFTAGVSAVFVPADQHEVTANAFFRRTLFTEPVPSSVQHRKFVSPGGTLQYAFHAEGGFFRNHASLGTDWQWQTIDEYRHPNNGGAQEGPEFLSDETIRQRGTGVFLLDRLEVGREWSLTAGLRYDNIRNELHDHLASDTLNLSGTANFEKTTGRLGVAWIPSAGLSLYANWGQGFLPPATEELANNPDNLGGFNRHLTSALSSGEELGVRGTFGGNFLYDLAAFYLETDKDFGRYRITARPLETFYGNIGSSRRYGLETYMTWQATRGLLAQVAYSYSHFTYTTPDSIKGNWLPNAPQHLLFVDLAYSPIEALTLGVSAEVQSRWYVDQLNVPSVGGFTLYHARIMYRWSAAGLQGDCTLSARNVFGKRYIAFSEPDPDGNSYQPGPTQELFAGIRVSL